jgi:transcriptional regulator with XRE-family HTH domain
VILPSASEIQGLPNIRYYLFNVVYVRHKLHRKGRLMTPAQCRAARAMLNWSQDDLEIAARVSKKTIADFERDHRSQQSRTIEAIEVALTAHGIIFIPQNGAGEGVRKRSSMPRLFRREDVGYRQWVAFAFDYKQNRITGFILYEALSSIALADIEPLAAFDRDAARILMCAAEKFDNNELDHEGQVLIRRGALAPVEFDASIEADPKQRVPLHLICRRSFVSSNGTHIEAIDYSGFRTLTASGKSKLFLKLRAGDADQDAFDVTSEATAGAFIVSERNREDSSASLKRGK